MKEDSEYKYPKHVRWLTSYVVIVGLILVVAWLGATIIENHSSGTLAQYLQNASLTPADCLAVVGQFYLCVAVAPLSSAFIIYCANKKGAEPKQINTEGMPTQ